MLVIVFLFEFLYIAQKEEKTLFQNHRLREDNRLQARLVYTYRQCGGNFTQKSSMLDAQLHKCTKKFRKKSQDTLGF